MWAAALALALTLLFALAAHAAVDETNLVSVAPDGSLPDGPSGPNVVVSTDGRWVVFESSADNLSDADVDSVQNIYAYDRETGEVQLVSRATGPAGAGGDGDSSNPALSPQVPEGDPPVTPPPHIAFESRATNLSDADDDAVSDVFVRNLVTGTTTLVSKGPGGSPADGDSGDPSISTNGAVVAFESRATNLSDLDHDAHKDVFAHSSESDTTRLISRPASGAPADGPSSDPSISYFGRRIAFTSEADNLFPDDRDLFENVYVALVEPAFTLLRHLSRTSASGSEDAPANGNSSAPVISASPAEDGRYVTFVSQATNLAGGVGLPQVFRRNVSANSTELVSRANGPAGAMASTSASSPSMSADGRLIAFATTAANLGEVGAAADDALRPPVLGSDVFVRDMAWEETLLASRDSGAAGAPFQNDSWAPAMAGSGGLVGFLSDVVVGELPPADPEDPESLPTDILQPMVFARELAWREPPPCSPSQCPPDDDSHHGGGDDHGGGDHTGGAGHTDGHADAAHAAGGHGAGHSGDAHFTLRMGGLGADRLFGSPLHDKICGGPGNDTILLGAGPDVAYGGDCGALGPPETERASWWRWSFEEGAPPRTADGNDEIRGRTGDDALYGGAGNDRLYGGRGRDFLSGGSGKDRLIGGPGRNRYQGGPGNDFIRSANGVRELVDCGFGRDRVTADRRDVLSGCERVKRVRRRARKDPLELLPECPGGGHECHTDEGGTVVLRGARRSG